MSSSSCSAAGRPPVSWPAARGRAGARQPRAPQRRAVRRALARPAVAAPARPASRRRRPGSSIPASRRDRRPAARARPARAPARFGAATTGCASIGDRAARGRAARQPVLLSATTPSPTCSTRSPTSRPCCSLAPGAAADQVAAASARTLARGALRAVRLAAAHARPTSTACSGRATSTSFAARTRSCARIWAGAPFVWQLYVQDDGAHAAKLDAFLDRFLAGAPRRPGRRAARAVRALERHRQRPAGAAAVRPDPAAAWLAHCAALARRAGGAGRPRRPGCFASSSAKR